MDKKQRKNFIITTIIITVFLVAMLFSVSYLMRNLDWWVSAITLFAILVVYGILMSYINHNYDFIMECMAEDYIDHSPAGARSNADAVGILKIVEGQFSDLKIEVLDVFGEEDMVATRILYQGIHAGTCMGIPATGKHISFEALENFRVVDGKIVESWGYWPDKEIEAKLR